MEEQKIEILPFRIYAITNGELRNPEQLVLTFVKAFASSGKASQYLRSKEFLSEYGIEGKVGQFIVVSEHQHYEVCPITMFSVQPIAKKVLHKS